MERVIGTLMKSKRYCWWTLLEQLSGQHYISYNISVYSHSWTSSHWVTKSIGLLDHTDYSGNDCISFLIASSPVTENGSGTYHEVLFWPSEDGVNNPTLFKRSRILREILKGWDQVTVLYYAKNKTLFFWLHMFYHFQVCIFIVKYTIKEELNYIQLKLMHVTEGSLFNRIGKKSSALFFS